MHKFLGENRPHRKGHEERCLIERLQRSQIKSNLILLTAFFAIVATAISGVAQSSESVIVAAPGQTVQEDITLGQGSGEVTLTIIDGVSGWTLYPVRTPNRKTGIFRLTTDSPWQVTVFSDTGGYLTEYDTTTGHYVSDGKRLRLPMNILVASSSGMPSYTGHKVNLRQGGPLVEGLSDLYDIEIPFTCEQDISLSDETLPEGHAYGMRITFTASSDS
jgi:hypothetical protein